MTSSSTHLSSSTHSRLAAALSAYMHRLRSIPGERPNAEFLEQVDLVSVDPVSLTERTPIIELVLREHLHERLIQDVRIYDALLLVPWIILISHNSYFLSLTTGTLTIN